MPKSKKPGWIEWRNCPAREILIQDLGPGGPLHNRDHILAEEIFVYYKQTPAFKDIVLDQFKAHLKDHRRAAGELLHRSMQEQQYFEHDLPLYPRQTHNERGQLVFDLSSAKMLLREDIKQNLHITKYPTAAKLKESRIEYKPFGSKKFSDRIRQEVKRNKYFHYLELKQQKLRDGKEQTK